MIAGISLILNPRTPHADEMKEILRLFMEQHPFNPKADDFTQQEATIVSYTTCIQADVTDVHSSPPRPRSRSEATVYKPAPSQHVCGKKPAHLFPTQGSKRLDGRGTCQVEYGFRSPGKRICLAVWGPVILAKPRRRSVSATVSPSYDLIGRTDL